MKEIVPKRDLIEADQVLVRNWALQVVNKLKTMMKDVRISHWFFSNICINHSVISMPQPSSNHLTC